MILTYRLIFTLVVCVGISDAFTANRTPFCSGRCEHVQLAKHEPEFAKQIVNTIGILTLGSILAFNAGDASASAPPPDASIPFFSSSSMQLAIEVKTMDMSMPSSYDAIAGAKSTGASLSKEIERTGAMPTNKVQREGEGPSLVSTVLPSTNKSKKKAPKEKTAKVQVEKEDKKFEKIKIVDMDMPSYSAPAKEKSAFSL